MRCPKGTTPPCGDAITIASNQRLGLKPGFAPGFARGLRGAAAPPLPGATKRFDVSRASDALAFGLPEGFAKDVLSGLPLNPLDLGASSRGFRGAARSYFAGASARFGRSSRAAGAGRFSYGFTAPSSRGLGLSP